MTITSLDLRVMQSQRMTDNADGGGRMSATQVVDGVMNNVFQDQSDLDRINGRVSLRKVFLEVAAANTDIYLGAFGFLTDPPADQNVSCLIFDTRSATDVRSAAQAYVENYRVKAVKSQFTLYGSHLAGQMTIQVYCRSEITSPDIGDVWCLTIEGSGYTPHEQYVCVQEVASRQTVTFTDGNGDFQRDVLILRITTALQFAFPGIEDPVRVTSSGVPTIVRFTQVADSARYYAGLPLVINPDTGDLEVKTASPYLTVVPTTTAETPLIDQPAGLDALAMIPCSAPAALAWSGTVTVGANVNVTRYFGTPYARRSLSLTVGGVALQDDGNGNIAPTDVAVTGWTGTADYATGAFTLSRDSGISGSVNATATAAGAVSYLSYSQALNITAANRQTSYVFQVPGRIGVGTLVIDYRSLGRWYRLRDTGRGGVAGNPGEGSGSVTYIAGSIALTLGALPDVDSPIIIAWGTDIRAKDAHADAAVTTVYRQQLAHGAIVPGTLVITWLASGVSKTASANSAGVISGDGAGSVEHASGAVTWAPGSPPDTDYHYAYDHVIGTSLQMASLTPSIAGGIGTITLPSLPQAGSVILTVTLNGPVDAMMGQLQAAGDLYDDATGGFSTVARLPLGTASLPGSNTGTWSAQTSSIDYGTGEIEIDVDQTVSQRLPTYTRDAAGNLFLDDWTLQPAAYVLAPGVPVAAQWGELSTASATEDHGMPPARIVFGGIAGRTVANTVRFTFRGDTYVDRAGVLVRAVNATTNIGTVAGTYDYLQNVAVIASPPSSGAAPALVSLLTREIDTGITGSVFRTPGAPLRPGSFTIRAGGLDGDTMITATADINGDIVDTLIEGHIDWQTGAARVRFGEMVTAAGHEAEPWYDPDAVDGGMIWRPYAVDPSSLFVGVVIYRSIPVDPELIGLDPVRLPSDGRVPVIRAGNTVIVHHTQETEIAVPVAGDIEDMGRTRLAFVEVYDALGEPVESVWYDIDLDAGTLTWADPLNLSAYTMPVMIRDRIEDAMLCTDVQITGEITLQRALTHDFPSGSIISSAITYGDMQARFTNLFDQQTYSAGVWSDVASGSPAAATYNDVIYPIAVSNDSAIDERWAIVFTGTTTVNVIGETVGQVLTGVSIGSDIAPVNPVSGLPYFSMLAAGFGSGWAAGNVIRFNTISATRPTWIARITKPGPVSVETDRTRFQVYGNAH